MRGSSLTEAAHAAGFADSAHLSRTFRSMFGITPSFLFRRGQLDVTFLETAVRIWPENPLVQGGRLLNC